MIKNLKVHQKALGVRHPKWFFKAIETLSGKLSELQLFGPPKMKIEPSGRALLELLFEEARIRNVVFRHSALSNSFPVHESGFSMDWFSGGLKPLFLERFLEMNEISDDLAFDFQMIFSELVQNAKDHSGSEKFLVWLTPEEIGVFDLGVSIPAKLEQKYEFKDDVEAIELALKERISTRRLRSGGMGLFYTFEFLKNKRGHLYIASRRGQLRQYFANKKVDRKRLDPKMHGTLIVCRLGAEDIE